MDDQRINPFTPGTGRPPPLRVGHTSVVRELAEELRQTLGGAGGNTMLLYGPQGSGKTALLFELAAWAKEGNAQVRLRAADRFPEEPKDVAQSIHDDGEKRSEVTASAQATDTGTAGNGATVRQARPSSVTSALIDLAKSRPTVLLIDDAHTLSPKVGSAILNAAQVCAGQRLPLLTVLAGPPGIRQALMKTGAGFWAYHPTLTIGQLGSDDETRRALSVPADQSGLPFDGDALNLLVSEVQRYPPFIQRLGNASWEAARQQGHDRISLADAQEGARTADLHRRELYGDQWREITGMGLREEALTVSRALTDRAEPALPRKEIEKLLGAAEPGGIVAAIRALDGLEALGLVWEASPGVWEPGIPSLWKFIAEQHRGG